MTHVHDAEGRILTPNGWVDGRVTFEGSKIKAITGRMLAPGDTPKAPFILPGFIDPHVHGGGGKDCLEGVEAVRTMVRFHAQNGTVAILPTTSTSTAEVIEGTLDAIAGAMADPRAGEAEIRGAHLEGPFINPKRLGAQDAPMDGDTDLAAKWAAMVPLRVATVAPEIPRGMEVARLLAAGGTRVQIGHSVADLATIDSAFAAGFTGFTHLFNAMTPVDHKDPGVASWALAHATHAEIVGDLRHVKPTTLLAAVRAIPQLYAITDAVGVAGLPDGEIVTRGGRRTVIKNGLDIHLKDHPETRAGSAATMIRVFQSLMSLGLPMELVSAMTSTRAADYLGFADLGRILPGRAASLVVLDDGLELAQAFVRGNPIL
ncbi:N-acetylglucosamine-6-phosphate deacetylase [Marinibacterium anthonyi]|nr:N-acetylglucosamine-6-phosphate deacetylase [Marinibacterium anthonyi]